MLHTANKPVGNQKIIGKKLHEAQVQGHDVGLSTTNTSIGGNNGLQVIPNRKFCQQMRAVRFV